jgi:hypothetical protein
VPSGVYKREYSERRLRPTFTSRPHGSTPRAQCSPTSLELAWAAGLIEGEGTFNRTGGKHQTMHTERIGVRQVDRECVDRLQRLFGGSVNPVDYSKNPISKAKTLWHWGVYGSRARGVMQTLYTFFSQVRRQQIRRALQREV